MLLFCMCGYAKVSVSVFYLNRKTVNIVWVWVRITNVCYNNTLCLREVLHSFITVLFDFRNTKVQINVFCSRIKRIIFLTRRGFFVWLFRWSSIHKQNLHFQFNKTFWKWSFVVICQKRHFYCYPFSAAKFDRVCTFQIDLI